MDCWNKVTDLPEYMELAVHRMSWSSWGSSGVVPSSSLVGSSVISDGSELDERDFVGDSRRVETKEGHAVPLFCEELSRKMGMRE